MLMLSVFSTTFVALYILTGLALAWRNSRSPRFGYLWSTLPSIRSKVLVLTLLLLIAWTYAGAVASRQYNPYDDFAAYFSLVKMLLDTGTLFDPFNFRLVGALGGQTVLSTLVLGFFPWKYAHLLDVGIAGLIMLGLTQEMVPGNKPKTWIVRVILVTLALMFPIPRANIAGELTGVVLFIALFRSFDLVAERRICGWRSAFLLGGVITATATLRAHYIFVMALLGISFALWRFWEDKQNRRDITRETLMTVVTTAILSAPWWVVAYRACGVFLYPLVKGTQRPEFELYNHQHLSLSHTLQFIGSFLISYNFLPLFLPACFLKRGRQQRILFVFAGAILLISIIFVSQLTFALPDDLYRYLAPIGVAFGLYTASIVAQQVVETPSNNGARFPALRAKLALTLAMMAIMLSTFHFLLRTVSNTTRIRRAINMQSPMWCKPSPEPVTAVFTNQAEQDYQRAFARIPLGAKTLIAVDYPFLLDYRLHSIFSIDVAGAASPATGLPYFHGPSPVKEYLLAQDIHYIAYVPFDRSKLLHSRACATYNLAGPEAVYRYLATFELDFYNNVDQLAKTNRVLFDSSTIRVVILDDRRID
jgi:hypothetical protein